MNDQKLTFVYWVSHGWYTLRHNSKLMVLGAMIYFSCSHLIYVLLSHLPHGRCFDSAFRFTISPVLSAGWWFLCLKLARGNSARLLDIFGGFRCFLKAWSTFILILLISFSGMILFLIPGIIWLLKYGLGLYVVMDKGFASHKAIAFSGKITTGYKIKLFMLLFPGSVVMFILTWPFAFGLRNIGTSTGHFYMATGAFSYIVAFLLVNPLLGATWATAYDTLSKHYEDDNTKNQI